MAQFSQGLWPAVINIPDPAAAAASAGTPPTHPFPGYWTTPLSASPTIVKQQSAQIVSNLLTQGEEANGASADFGVTINDGTPRFVVHGKSIASTIGWTPIYVHNNQETGNPTGYLSWPVPLGWRSSTGTDHEYCSWDLDDYTIGDFTGQITRSAWSFQQNTSTPHPGQTFTQQTAPAGASASYGGFGAWSQDKFPSGSTATTGTTTASGAPYIAVQITYADYLSGSIDHVLGLTVAYPTAYFAGPCVASDGNPLSLSASTTSGSGVSYPIPYGSLFMMPASVTMPDFVSAGSPTPALAQQVFTCLQKYGMVAVDQTAGNGCALAFEAIGPWTEWSRGAIASEKNWYSMGLAYEVLKGMPWDQLQVVVPPQMHGKGGGGTAGIRQGGYGGGYQSGSTTVAVMPSTIEAGDTLVLSIFLKTQTWAPGTVGGSFTYMGDHSAAGCDFSCWTKTATSSDAGASYTIAAGDATSINWYVVDVADSPGASLLYDGEGFQSIATPAVTLPSNGNLTLALAAFNGNGKMSTWPDGFTQLSWVQNTYSIGAAGFYGPAYGDVACADVYNTDLFLHLVGV